MCFGLGILRLAPRDFWSLTPRELQCAMAAHGAPTRPAFTRRDLLALMQAFPDEVST